MSYTLWYYASGTLIRADWPGDNAPITSAAAKREAERIFNAADGPEGVAVKDETGRVVHAAVCLGENEEEE